MLDTEIKLDQKLSPLQNELLNYTVSEMENCVCFSFRFCEYEHAVTGFTNLFNSIEKLEYILLLFIFNQIIFLK